MKKILKLLTTLALAVLILIGCATDDNDTQDNANGTAENTTDTEEVTTLSFGYMPNYASVASVIAAMETDAFADENIEIELVEFADGPTIIAAMESGSIDIGYIGPGAHVLPVQGHADIFAFSQLGDADEVLGLKNAGIETIEDLEGKSIGVSTGTSSEMILNLTLEAAGLTREDVELIDMDASAITTSIISESVDAVATWSPNTIAIKDELGDDVVKLSSNADFAEKAPSIASFVVHPSYVDENEELLIRFTRALYKGADYKVENLEEVAVWVANHLALDEEAIKQEVDTGAWPTSEELLSDIQDGTIAGLYDIQAENFVVEGRLTEDELRPAEEYILFDIMEAGLE